MIANKIYALKEMSMCKKTDNMCKNYKPAKYYDSINFLLNIIMNKHACKKNW